MELPIAIVDAFTDQPFRGNPAATVLLDQFLDPKRMQQIAAEMNLSETAFAVWRSPNCFDLRWFTPTQEVPLCGHATLAMAHDLRELGAVVVHQPVTFQTLSGDLVVTYDEEGIIMDFPACTPVACAAETLTHLSRWLGDQLRDQFWQCVGVANQYVTVVLATEKDVLTFQPDLDRIVQLEGIGLIITAIADPHQPYDFVSRFFAPKAGIPEDPVTGSAHCILTPYWAKQLGKTSLRARQCSTRSGDLVVHWQSDRNRVLLQGKAITVLRGMLTF